MKHPTLRGDGNRQPYINLLAIIELYQKALIVYRQRTASPTDDQGTSSERGKKVTYKRSDKKVTVQGRSRTIYLGKHNKHYVQINKQMVAVSSLRK